MLQLQYYMQIYVQSYVQIIQKNTWVLCVYILDINGTR